MLIVILSYYMETELTAAHSGGSDPVFFAFICSNSTNSICKAFIYIFSLSNLIIQKDVMKYVHQEVWKPELGSVRRFLKFNLCSGLQKKVLWNF